MSPVGNRILNNRMPIQAPLTRKKLVETKRKAIRRGVWFAALSRVERVCIELTIKVVDRVRSHHLTKILTALVEKLSRAMENKITRLMREVGYELALKLSRIAQTWGNPHAAEWAMDLKFIEYLTITEMNASEAHKT